MTLTLTGRIALTTLPPQIKTIAPEIIIEENGEEPFYESKYQVNSARTFRTLVVQFSDYPEQILSNTKLMATLKSAEKSGLPVPSEKLFALVENVGSEWIAQINENRIKIKIIPSQAELSQLAPKIVMNGSFELAFQHSLAVAQVLQRI